MGGKARRTAPLAVAEEKLQRVLDRLSQQSEHADDLLEREHELSEDLSGPAQLALSTLRDLEKQVRNARVALLDPELSTEQKERMATAVEKARTALWGRIDDRALLMCGIDALWRLAQVTKSAISSRASTSLGASELAKRAVHFLALDREQRAELDDADRIRAAAREHCEVVAEAVLNWGNQGGRRYKGVSKWQAVKNACAALRIGDVENVDTKAIEKSWKRAQAALSAELFEVP